MQLTNDETTVDTHLQLLFSTVLGPTQPPIQWILGCSLPRSIRHGAWS